MVVEKFCDTLLTNTLKFELVNSYAIASEKVMVAISLVLSDKKALKYILSHKGGTPDHP